MFSRVKLSCALGCHLLDPHNPQEVGHVPLHEDMGVDIPE